MNDLFDTPPAADPTDAVTLDHYAERAYLEYALSVVKELALPEVLIANSIQRGRTRSGWLM